MKISFAGVRHAVMGVSDAEATSFSEGDTAQWTHLKTAVLTAVGGYRAVLDASNLDKLVPRLDAAPLELRGYAYDGAAMGLTVLDCFFPGSRLDAYLAGPGSPHIYMAHIGAGEALARLRRRPEPFIAKLKDRVLCWLVMDGYGFHEGFFKPERFVEAQELPRRLSPFGQRVFDQGLGRSVWFRSGADPELIIATIARFSEARQADLWLGIGVVCAYVGGVGQPAVETLRAAAGHHAGRLAIGAAFVAQGRDRAGTPAEHTALATRVLCGLSAQEASDLVATALRDLPVDGPEPAYHHLQERLAACLTASRKDVA